MGRPKLVGVSPSGTGQVEVTAAGAVCSATRYWHRHSSTESALVVSRPHPHSSNVALTVVFPAPSNSTPKLEALSEIVAIWLFAEHQAMAIQFTTGQEMPSSYWISAKIDWLVST